jgi:hypothetical protein
MNKLLLFLALFLSACQPTTVIIRSEMPDGQKITHQIVIIPGELAGVTFKDPALRPVSY